jgi:hypothetical protein
MGFFKKKADPISDRAKVLNAQIASLEAEIKKLSNQVEDGAAQPRVRSTVSARVPATANVRSAPLPRDPVFEPVDHRHLEPASDHEHTPQHYNDLGVRKYDLAAAWHRFRNHFRTPPAGNPKLVTYLAAGSIRGLRPLRYEKRVARNRFALLFVLLVFLVWGIIAVLVRH